MTTWTNPEIDYLFNEEIIEYDIRDAGFSIIKEFRLLPLQKIKELELLEKGFERHKAIGILQRDDKVFAEKFLDKFAEVRDVFIQANGLTSEKMISVKKDAIFTFAPCKRLKFGQVVFVEKNRYSSYIHFPNIHNVEIYYSKDKLDVKGIGDIGLNRHRLTMLEFLSTMISRIESRDVTVRRYLINFIMKYKGNDLDEEYYLEFNNMSAVINPEYNYRNILIPFVQIVQREMSNLWMNEST